MKRIQIIDYARFLAAMAVLVFHYLYNGIANGKVDSITHNDALIRFAQFGFFGVEFFFMISGYVIFFSARNRKASAFLASRAKRLYPPYWVAVIFTSIFAIFFGGELMAVDAKMIIANFSLFQNYLGFESVDGVYWTLYYELRFYLAVSIILFLGLGKYLREIFLVWPFIIIGFHVFGISNSILLIDSHYLYFAAGGLFALATEKLSPTIIISLVVTFFACFYIDSRSLSSIHAGLIVACFFIFFLLCLIPWIRDLSLPLSGQLGAITYPLYLIHAHFGYMMLSLFATDSNKWIVYSILVPVVLLIAWILHHFIEVKLAPFWNKFFLNLVERPLSKLELPIFSGKIATEED